MSLRFWKMHGAGNDFVLFDARARAIEIDPSAVRRIADRRRGVGCDQLLIVTAGADGPAYRIYNADGSEALQCGNGARCVARFLLDRGALEPGEEIQSPAGPVKVTVDGGRIGVTLAPPSFDPATVPFAGGSQAVVLAGKHWPFEVLSLGNPHAVVSVADPATVPLAVAEALQADPRFPAGVNVGFCAQTGCGDLHLRVIERGVGETLACGSGACAAMAVGRRAGRLGERVRVVLPGGTLHVSWPGEGAPMTLAGPADYAFTGILEKELLHD